MSETKQGVAQKFIDQRKRVHEYLSSHGDYAAVNTGHALEECQALAQLLSKELRELMSELDAQETEPGAGNLDYERGILELVANRLGLDLEGDDS